LNTPRALCSRAFSYKLSGSYYEQDPWERDNLLPNGSPMPPQATFENKGTRQPKFDARIDFDADRERVWSVRGALASTSGLTHSALGPGEFDDGSYYSYAEVEHRRPTLDARVYWNRLHSPYTVVLFGLHEEATADTFAGDVTKRLTAAQHQLAFGGGFNVDRFDVSIAPDDDRRADAGAFVEDRFAVSPAVTLIGGLRVDKFDTTPAVLAPRVGATVSPRHDQTFRVTYNRAYRGPSLLENFVDVPLPSVIAERTSGGSTIPIVPPFFYMQQVLGSTELEMEKLDAFELGYTGAIGSRTVVFATVYDQRVDNKIWFLPATFYGPGAPPPGWPYGDEEVPFTVNTYSFLNLGSVRNRGVELAARFDLRQLSLQGTYTFQGVPEQEGEGSQLQINRPSRHLAGGSAIFASKGWTASGSVYYTGSAFWADVLTPEFWGTTSSFVAVNGSASYRFGNQPWEVRVDATNLLDEDIKRHVYGDIIRRRVTVGLRWRWDRPI
jgi:outer membrane receptor protein involved in Fe transport